MNLSTKSPDGLALFVRRLSARRHLSPHSFAKKCSDHGLKWIAIGAVWHDVMRGKERNIYINKPEIISDYARALHAAGVIPHIWGYPWHDRIDRFVEEMEKCSISEIAGWLLDPELGLKGHPDQAGELFKKSRALNPYRLLGMSSYAFPDFHKNFPFSKFASRSCRGDLMLECDYGCPQLYDMDRKGIIKGISAYDNLGFDNVVPAFGIYKWDVRRGKRIARPYTPGELDTHLKLYRYLPVHIRAGIGWAENFMNDALWDKISEWADMFGTQQV
jgi:hypothetical protein